MVPRADRAGVADVLAPGPGGATTRPSPFRLPGAVHRAGRQLPRLRRHRGRRLGAPRRQGRRQRQGRDDHGRAGRSSPARTSTRPRPARPSRSPSRPRPTSPAATCSSRRPRAWREDQFPRPATAFAADLVWTGEEELRHGRSYLLLAGSLAVPAVVTAIRGRRDVVSGEEMAARTLKMNDIGHVEIATDTAGAARPVRASAATPAASCSSSGSAATPSRPGWCGTRCAARTTSSRTRSPSTARRARS